MSFKTQFVLKQEITGLYCTLGVASSIPSIDLESKLASAHKELAMGSDTIGELQTEEQTSRRQIDYNDQRANAQ